MMGMMGMMDAMHWPNPVASLALWGRLAPYRSVVLAVATLVATTLLYRWSRGQLRRYLAQQAHKQENARAFLRGYDAVGKVLIGVVVVVAAAGSFTLLGLTVGFLGTMLGWSLQTPIRGLAAWVMVVLNRPFRVGDRIHVAGVTGDVHEIQLNHVVLNQVGGTVAGEERSGRGIYVPTAMLFGEQIINYNLFRQTDAEPADSAPKLMLAEVPVRITLGSDLELAKALCVQAARQALAELGGEGTREPFTRAEFFNCGIRLFTRYEMAPAQRERMAGRVTELIWEAFHANADKVRFCPPVSVEGIIPRPDHPLPPIARRPYAPGERSRPNGGAPGKPPE